MTPLMAAVNRTRADITSVLIEQEADLTVWNVKEESLLCTAVQKGDLDTISVLVNAQAPPNDGSLHNAAILCNSKAVRLLLGNGHKAEFSSAVHGGLDALEALCLNCQAKKTMLIRQTIEEFARAGYEPRSCIFLALDNQYSCREVTSALVEAYMFRHLDDHTNLFRVNDHVYSPKSYVVKGIQRSSPEYGADLQRILTLKSVEIYYRERGSGDQPDDIRGAPDPVMKEYQEQCRRRQRRAEEEKQHQLQLARERQIHETRLAQENEDLRLRLEREKTIHEARIALETQTAILQRQNEQREHALALEQDAERAKARDDSIMRTANLERQIVLQKNSDVETFTKRQRMADVNHVKLLAAQELETVGDKNRLMLEYTKDNAAVEQTIQEHRVKYARDMENNKLAIANQNRQADEEMNSRNHNREMLLIKEKRAGTKENLKLLESQRSLMRAASSAQRQISYDIPD